MKKNRSCVCSFLLVLVVLPGWIAAPSAGAALADAPLTIGIIPFYTPEKIFSLYSPMVDYLNRTSRNRWELVLGNTHQELMDKLARSEISVALLGPIPFAQVKKRAAVRPLLVTLTPSGETNYHSIIITANPAIGTLSDLKGKTFAYFPGSTAAHYVPLAMLAEQGVTVAPELLVLCNSQDRVVTAVQNGEAVAGGIKEALFKKLTDPRLKALESSRPLPQFVLTASPGLPAEAAEDLVTVLLNLKPLAKQGDRDLMKSWDAEVMNGFAIPSEDYGRQTGELLEKVAPFSK